MNKSTIDLQEIAQSARGPCRSSDILISAQDGPHPRLHAGWAGGEPDPALPARPVHHAPLLPSRLRLRGPDRVLHPGVPRRPALLRAGRLHQTLRIPVVLHPPFVRSKSHCAPGHPAWRSRTPCLARVIDVSQDGGAGGPIPSSYQYNFNCVSHDRTALPAGDFCFEIFQRLLLPGLLATHRITKFKSYPASPTTDRQTDQNIDALQVDLVLNTGCTDCLGRRRSPIFLCPILRCVRFCNVRFYFRYSV